VAATRSGNWRVALAFRLRPSVAGSKEIRLWTPKPRHAKSRSSRPNTSKPSSYEQAIIAYRQHSPHHGAIRIAVALQDEFAFAHRGTVALILKAHGLTRKRVARAKPAWKIPVGKHRLQMDIQQLPAIAGSRGFEYKISLIH